MNDILDLTFSMDADEEKHILYEKTEVCDKIDVCFSVHYTILNCSFYFD